MRKASTEDATKSRFQGSPNHESKPRDSQAEQPPEEITREAIDSFERWVEAFKIRVTTQS